MIGSLCSGIGGLELGLERAGLGPVAWQVEADPFCRAVLTRHWPEATRLVDVKTASFRLLPRVRVICGGWPCQPVSVAGARRAQADERWLWPHVARALEEQAPAVFVGENVPGLLSAGMHDVLADLARLGFNAEWETVSAAHLGAPHLRRRVFLVATHPDRIDFHQQPGWVARAFRAEASQPVDSFPGCPPTDTDCQRRLEHAWRFAQVRGWPKRCGWDFNPFAGVDDGVSERVGERTRAAKALGNAVVPQIAEAIGRAVVAGLQCQ